jgi:hypothetical protein
LKLSFKFLRDKKVPVEVAQRMPVKPVAQMHTKVFRFVGVHLPPLLHGLGLQTLFIPSK